MKLKKLVSGGQSGVDRGTLDFAICAGLDHGGYCPKGRIAEDGQIPRKYRLTETASAKYPPRTRLNILESDATVIFIPTGHYSPGSDLTVNICRDAGKPHLVTGCFPSVADDADAVARFLLRYDPESLNVAGPRESKVPGMSDHVFNVLATVVQALTKQPQPSRPCLNGTVDERLKLILGPMYGGPSVSHESGDFVIYTWGDAPPGTEAMARGPTLKLCLDQFDRDWVLDPGLKYFVRRIHKKS